MAHLGKIWVLNAERGIKRRALQQMGIPVENIEVFPGPGEEITFEGIQNEWKRIREELNKDPNAYVGTGLDSITEMQQALAGTVGAAAVIRANRAGRERNPSVMDQDSWRETNWYCREIIRAFSALPCHFAISALPRRDQDDSATVVYQPSVTPSLQTNMVGWMDMVCYTSVAIVEDEEEYRGLFRPHSKFRGKDRLHVMPKWLVNPTFDRVFKYAEGDLTVATDPIMQSARERAQRAKQAEAAEPAAA
jgi:hypothetical protein